MNLPYQQIPDYPETYASGNILARLLDGMGYRYHWATEGLRPEDLDFRVSPDSRTTLETLEHIYTLSKTILNATENMPNIRPANIPEMALKDMRRQTLVNIQLARTACTEKSQGELADLKVIYQRGESRTEFPFWNVINGQIADALYHVGQVVAFRRAAGNPLDTRVNVFLGKTRD